MAFSKLYFGTFVPPDLKLKAPGFDPMTDGANAPKPRWFTHPVHSHPAWMQGHEYADEPKQAWRTGNGAPASGMDAAAR
jgi:hypothetical protein